MKSIVTQRQGHDAGLRAETLSGAEIDTVAAFVAGEEPAAATPEATATPKPEREPRRRAGR